MYRPRLLITAAFFGVVLTIAGVAQAATPTCGAGQVYTETNDPAGNQLVVLKASRSGALTQRQLVNAGGLGTGEHLTSGGSVVVSTDGCRVAAVNAASGAVAMFTIAPNGQATFAGSASTGGARTISVALYRRTLAALSTTPDGATTIRTFRINPRSVKPIPGSLQPVGEATDGGQIAFTADGGFLVVTTRMSHGILTFRVGTNGVPAPAGWLIPDAPLWPYGFALTSHNQAIVSLFDIREPVSGAYASYALSGAGVITPVTAPLPNQLAACWVAIAPNGKYAWGVNFDAMEVVTLKVSATGAITAGRAVSNGTSPGRDLAVSADGRFAYLLRPDAQDIYVFRIGARGALTLVGSSPTPASAVATAGMAAS